MVIGPPLNSTTVSALYHGSFPLIAFTYTLKPVRLFLSSMTSRPFPHISTEPTCAWPEIMPSHSSGWKMLVAPDAPTWEERILARLKGIGELILTVVVPVPIDVMISGNSSRGGAMLECGRISTSMSIPPVKQLAHKWFASGQWLS